MTFPNFTSGITPFDATPGITSTTGQTHTMARLYSRRKTAQKNLHNSSDRELFVEAISSAAAVTTTADSLAVVDMLKETGLCLSVVRSTYPRKD